MSDQALLAQWRQLPEHLQREVMQYIGQLLYAQLTQRTVSPKEGQLAHLQRLLMQQTRPLFPAIVDPVLWQRQQRDEWA